MAKPLGPKTILIREAILAHPGLSNTPLAELINGSDARKEDKIHVTPNDVAQQRQAMKKPGAIQPASAATPVEVSEATTAEAEAQPKKRGRPSGKKQSRAAAKVAATPTSRPQVAAKASPFDLIDGVFTLARQCGGIAELKRLVDRIAEGEGREPL